jgi:N-acetylmuramoyl-L-alanine amidase
VVIDPGHGGNDPGVVWGEVTEKDLVLVLSFEIQQILESNGYSCRLTRSRDLSLPMEQRSGVANYYHPRVFISLHIGGSPSSSTRSSTIYVHDQVKISNTNLNGNHADGLVPWAEAQGPHLSESGKLAERIRLSLKSLGEEPSPTLHAPLTVLSSVAVPAVLIEVGYLTNPTQRENLLHQAFRTQIAEAISLGVSDYLRNSVAPE